MSMNFQQDNYKILGVAVTATKEEIKAAYRKLVMRYHPDRNPDDASATEKLQQINEAYDVLSSDIDRYVYDEYKQQEARMKVEEAAETTGAPTAKNKKTYERKTKVRTERKVYLKGIFTARYWAEQEHSADLFVMREVNYTINPVSAEAVITGSDIHAYKAPEPFEKIYREAELFRTPVPQPVHCKIINGKGEELYDLFLQDLRIINPVLSDITKHEKQSLGTLTGEFYAYVLRIDEKEITETVTECFGETGNVEYKAEEGNHFFRKEYYHKDCTSYWAAWQLIPKAKQKSGPAKTSTASSPGSYKARTTTATAAAPVVPVNHAGCAQWWWVPLCLLYLFVYPQFFLKILAVGFLLYLLTAGSFLFSRLFSFLGLLFLGYCIYAAFTAAARPTVTIKRTSRSSYDSLTTSTSPITVDSSASSSLSPDTLISHYVQWKDYDSNRYAVTLSVSVNQIKNSVNSHNNLELRQMDHSLTGIYNAMDVEASMKLGRIYTAFDSIRIADTLNERAFACMVVSCVQSLPYYLILDRSCAADYSSDEFISNYLKQCSGDCCVGTTKFGVRSPVEFAGDLKGDCDTRALFIYTILKKFNYNVALLCSEYYKHAVIAVDFGDSALPNGLSMNINNQNYYLWETTNTGFQPGQIPAAISNLSYWTVSLLHEKNN